MSGAANSARTASPLLVAPVLPTLVRLALPNGFGMVASAAVSIAETAYIGRLGIAPLAAMALVFPMVMLTQMMSAGAMGGGVSSAISRALGAGDQIRANELARHAMVIGAALAGLLSAIFLIGGPHFFRWLGGRGEAHALAVAYANLVFSGILTIWLFNMLASILRGAGSMTPPALTALAVAVLQIGLGGCLAFGVAPFPRLGMIGVGLAQITAFGVGALVLFALVGSGRARVQLRLRGAPLSRALFWDILRVGLPSLMSPVQSILTVLIFTGLIGRLGAEALAGYGIGARLEFLLIPIAFSIGMASVPVVGAAIGAGDVARARRAAWTAAGLAFASLGAIGLFVSVFPDFWARLFTSNPGVLASARAYLHAAGPAFGLFGVALCLYFASQGAGRVLGPLLAGTVRLALVAIVGVALVRAGAPDWSFYALAGAAMATMGLVTAAFVHFTPWRAAAKG